jgi:UDP-N-acetylmuramoyl-L-alanyl-D-glutamate--2,6-diaminopimelate ligase
MTFAELITPLEVLETSGDLNTEICEVTDDSRQIKRGSVFVAVKGAQFDGHAFTDQAWRQGAVGVVMEKVDAQEGQEKMMKGPRGYQQNGAISKPVVWVRNSRYALGLIASQFHGNPSHRLTMIGVTGTNGKTTVTHLIKALMEKAGRAPGLLGTVGYFIGSQSYTAFHTTPGAVELQNLLGNMVEAGVDTAILEVSSHALSLDRVAGCDFDVVVFTNLTQDHLDFHTDMDEYFHSKLRLFTEYVEDQHKSVPKRAIVNLDDERGVQIIQQTSIPVWTYGIQAESDIRASDIQLFMKGTTFKVRTPHGPLSIRSRLVGEHNVYNILAAIGVGLQFGMAPSAIESALQSVENVPGRFEQVDDGQDFSVVVDYAHTEDALLRLLAAANSVKKGRIITVFGCGGDRDPGKRPKMGQAAVQHSDMVFLTSDNPRTEDPLRILHDIEAGILDLPSEARCEYHVIPGRREAIERAITTARPEDLVLIAGKGHEDYQLVGTRRLDFDDRQIAREAILRYRPHD